VAMEKKNIVLIGFMGTGKSAVGQRLAERLGRKFVDMDREIENLIGMSIKDLFKEYGEIRFRSDEKLMAKELSQYQNLVITTGGGTVLAEENLEVLKSSGVLVCLDASPEDILERVNRKKGTRPLLKKNVQLEDIKKMMEEREPYYSRSDYRLSTSNKDLNSIVNEIIKSIGLM